VQLEDVCAAADALVAQGLKPTIERVRRHLGGGSPNTVSALLDDWFARLPARLTGAQPVGQPGQPREDELPLSVVQAARQFWEVARREADQAQLQLTEASRRELELQREATTRKEAELQQREASFEQSRAKLDEALTDSKQALGAMQEQVERQQQESARLLGESEAEVRRLRKALDEAVAGKETLREQMAMELGAKRRAASPCTRASPALGGRSRAHGDAPGGRSPRDGKEGACRRYRGGPRCHARGAAGHQRGKRGAARG
jgi:hypothetical protein